MRILSSENRLLRINERKKEGKRHVEEFVAKASGIERKRGRNMKESGSPMPWGGGGVPDQNKSSPEDMKIGETLTGAGEEKKVSGGGRTYSARVDGSRSYSQIGAYVLMGSGSAGAWDSLQHNPTRLLYCSCPGRVIRRVGMP